MISKEEVKKIADLARIDVGSDQVEKYQKELSAILDFVHMLTNADVADTLRIMQITGLESVFRKDDRNEVGLQYGRELIKQAPEHRDGYVVVPEVLKGKRHF